MNQTFELKNNVKYMINDALIIYFDIVPNVMKLYL